MRKPELLAPAGDMERLRMAVLYGADAVYLAGTSFGMRSFAGNFSPEELPEAVAFAHAHGVRVHVTVNTMPRGDELPALPAHLRLLNDSGVDALILADLGVFRMAQREAPNCELHISTQVSIANAPALPRGMSSAQSALCWHGSFLSRRSASSAAIRRRSWSWRRLRTGPCACRTPAAACCPTI